MIYLSWQLWAINDNDLSKLDCLYNKLQRVVRQINLKGWVKAKGKWTQDGDRNTKFYHYLVTIRCRRNLIQYIQSNISCIYDSDLNLKEFVNFYSGLQLNDINPSVRCLETISTWPQMQGIIEDQGSHISRPFDRQETST